MHCNMPKISIIMPIYNMEKSLRKSIDSVLKQTYRNFELILVNDGSIDSSPKICDDYARADNRIKVIHKPNGGVSSARNAGLEQAQGELIGWVDPDDWIEIDMYEYLLKGLEDSSADIAVCCYSRVEGNKIIKNAEMKKTIYTREGAIHELLLDKVLQNYLWDKLFKRELFEGIEFPVNRTFEDIAVVYQLFYKADRIVYLPESKYFYRMHGESIVNTMNLKNATNFYISMKERYIALSTEWPEEQVPLVCELLKSGIFLWSAGARSSKNEVKEHTAYFKEISELALKYRWTAIKVCNLGITGKISLTLLAYNYKWSYYFTYLLRKLYGIKHLK